MIFKSIDLEKLHQLTESLLSYLICRISFYLKLKYQTGSGLYLDWKWFQGSKSSELSYIKCNHLLHMGYVGDNKRRIQHAFLSKNDCGWVNRWQFKLRYIILNYVLIKENILKETVGFFSSLNLSFWHTNFIFHQSYSSASKKQNRQYWILILIPIFTILDNNFIFILLVLNRLKLS